MDNNFAEFHPVSSNKSQEEDAMINTILPSYHMFQATVSKKLIPNEESFKEDPPIYEISPMNSGTVTPVPASIMGVSSNAFPFPPALAQEDQDNDVFNQNSAQLWETTVLANVHKLDSLSHSNNAIANHLDVNVFFSDTVCQKGVKPNLIDPTLTEYKQGDYIHGYVTIENTHHEPIPFDMVYVAFEGVLYVRQTPVPTKNVESQPTVFKFLNMLDLFASWSYANIDRLVTDSGDPHDWCEGETDPYDNTVLSIDVKRLFQPGVTYKRFFSFRLPERLLDDCCDHNLDAHCQVLPTLGHPLNLSAMGKLQEKDKKIKDLSFMDTSVGYSVSARVIGRASQYSGKAPKSARDTSDSYVLAQEVDVPLRVLPWTGFVEQSESHSQEVSAYLAAFLKTVKSKIETGRLVKEAIRAERQGAESGTLSPLSSRSSRVSLNSIHEKVRNLYISPTSSHTKGLSLKQERLYQHTSAYRKKTLTGFGDSVGTVSLSTPKSTLRLAYVPPLAYRNPLQAYNTKLRVPIELTYLSDSGSKSAPPEVKLLNCELLVLTIRSKKHYLPVELNHDMCYLEEYVDDTGLKKIEDMDSFDSLVIKPFNECYQKLVSLMKDIGLDNEQFRVETQLFKDIKSMAMLQTKKINLAIPDVTLSTVGDKSMGRFKNITAVPWQKSPTRENCYVKQVELDMDLNSCHLKGGPEVPKGQSAFDTLCLVPHFQSCLMTRFYFVRVSVRYKNGSVQAVHVPLEVVC